MSRIVFAGGGTGGHLYPALALGSALEQVRPGLEVAYIGAQRGIEARVLPEKGVEHRLLPLEPLRRDQVWRNWRLPLAMGRSLMALRREFRERRPAAVVCTGGYASGPAGLVALMSGIPIALQEQNSYPGLTIRWLSRWASQIHLGFPEAEQHLSPGSDTRVFALGNPIQPPAEVDRVEARRAFGLSPDATVLLVVGGSQGALALNEALVGALERVAAGDLPSAPAGLEILWATGPAHIYSIEQRMEALSGLPTVRARGYIDEMPKALAAADIALSRAGAMMTAELQAWGIPMMLVPLPTAAADHQTHNARALEQAGAALFLPQAELTPDRLWQAVMDLAGDDERRHDMGTAARERGRPEAAHRIAEALLTMVQEAA